MTNPAGQIDLQRILSYNRRIAVQHGHFAMEDYRKWLKKAERDDLARALRRLASLTNQKYTCSGNVYQLEPTR